MRPQTGRIGSVYILDLVLALAILRVDDIAQDGEQPGMQVRATLKVVELAPGAD